MKEGNFVKETVLITGATSGIGLEMAKIFAKKKYNLVLVARNTERLLKMKWDFEKKYKTEIMVIPADLAKEKSAEEIYGIVEAEKRQIDILINNAGIGHFGAFYEEDWEKINDMVTLNLTTVMHMTKLFMNGMVRRGYGRILNVASTAAFAPGPLMAVYFATKAGVLSFTEAIAEELKGSGVTVTALCPGPTRTGFEKAAECEKSKLFNSQPLAEPKEVASYAYYSMMSGKVVAIHGVENRLSALILRFMPRSIVRKAVHYGLGEI